MEKRYNAILEFETQTVCLDNVTKDYIKEILKKKVEIENDKLFYIKWEPVKNV